MKETYNYNSSGCATAPGEGVSSMRIERERGSVLQGTGSRRRRVQRAGHWRAKLTGVDVREADGFWIGNALRPHFEHRL
jgi:hypothetical protein